MIPLVTDLSHHNQVTNMKAVYDAGIRGIIHKATEGTYYKDATYKARRQWALDNGLLWGAYHFCHSGPVEAQVNYFLDYADPDGTTLLALDFEENTKGTMSLAQAKQFLQLVRDKTGQKPKLYGGSLLKEKLGKTADPFLASHRLWMPQYGPKATLPVGWHTYWLWQYTGDGVGPAPHGVKGITGNAIDLNAFGGKDLKQEWVDNLSII
jgi:lysozyme